MIVNVITLANHKGRRRSVNQSELQVNTCSRWIVRGNVCEPFIIGFVSTSDWMRSGAISKGGNQKTKANAIYL